MPHRVTAYRNKRHGWSNFMPKMPCQNVFDQLFYHEGSSMATLAIFRVRPNHRRYVRADTEDKASSLIEKLLLIYYTIQQRKRW
jgi:hypothetical protein